MTRLLQVHSRRPSAAHSFPHCGSLIPLCSSSISSVLWIKMSHSCVYCGQTNTFRTPSGLEKHLLFCSKVPGKKKGQSGHQASLNPPKRASNDPRRNHQKQARYRHENSHSSGDKDDNDHRELPSHPQDGGMPDEPHGSLVSTNHSSITYN